MAMLVAVLAVPIDENAAQDYAASLPDGEAVAQDDFEKPTTESLKAQKCPNGWKFCGVRTLTSHKS